MNSQNHNNKEKMTEVLTMAKDNQKAAAKNAGDIALMNLRVDMITDVGRQPHQPTAPEPQSKQVAIKPKDYQ
jgi:hypothetical protein